MILVTAAEAMLIVRALENAPFAKLSDGDDHATTAQRVHALSTRLGTEARKEHERAERDLARAARRGPLVGIKPTSPAARLIRDRGPKRKK